MIKANIELWKDVKDYEGLYQVSTLGRVRSLDKYVNTKNRNVDKVLKRGKILKPTYNQDGYLTVSLYKDGKGTRFLVHRLVAEAFISNPLNLPVINHKDEVKDNNHPYNLEWCTDEYNKNYGTAIKRSAEKRSKKVYQYDLQGNLINVWASTMDCDRNGYDHRTISACCLGKLKTHQNFIWSYKPIENFDINNYKNKSEPKTLYQYDMYYNLIRVWDSVSEASRNGFDKANISKCCSGKEKFHKGFIWSYTELA